MSDYTPTTDEVRDIYTWDRCVRHGRDDSLDTRLFRAEFDRWLAAHDAEVQAERDALAARLAAVEALADEWGDLPCVCGYVVPNGNDDRTQCLSCGSVDLRAVLSATPTTEEPR